MSTIARTTHQPTREEALQAAAEAFNEGRRQRDSLPVEEAARRAMVPGGPSFEELCRRIAELRGLSWPAGTAGAGVAS